MAGLPSALFVSTCDENPENVIKLILNDLPLGKIEDNVTMYDWHINTKYYEADIKLCSINQKTLSSPEFASSVEAIIIIFDPISPRGFQPIFDWMPFLNEYEAEVKILICSRCQDSINSALSKVKVQEWCVKEGFELVELEPLLDEEWQNEQDFIETFGIERVIQALQAHIWPNLIMKERKDPTSMSGLLHGGFCKSAHSPYDSHLDRLEKTVEQENSRTPGNVSDSGNSKNNDGKYSNAPEDSNTPTNSRKPLDNLEPTLEELLSHEGTDFCDLFSQLPAMKEQASAMPREQRKKFAEDVVLAYWKAIGGDQDEILDC
ncbi:hypothetical protein O3M35_004246 [Rhynocoris fuscipes]|uniref:Alpha-and gamma-adaptin-binding protein p34 n=1 Tax=Rhynocoris fuscipes TaxID=488301 RepID=A0AAW1CGM9_9HEMI